MNVPVDLTPWLQSVEILAAESMLIVGLTALVVRCTQSALWRRTFWQAATLGLFLVALAESTGIARDFANWSVRAISTGSIDAVPTRSNAEPEQPGSTEATGPQVTADVRSGFAEQMPIGEQALSNAVTPSQALPVATPPVSKSRPIVSPSGGEYSDGAAFSSRLSRSSIVQWLQIVWLFGSGLLAARICLARLMLAIFVGRQAVVCHQPLQERVQSLAAKLGISRRIRVIASARLSGPIAFGVLRPTIGLPKTFGENFSVAQQEVTLAHELAHVAARDPAWHLVAELVTVLLWWHPLVWWSRNQLHEAAEAAADEASLLVADGPAVLAECLLELGSRLAQPRSLGWMAIGGFRSGLGRRVQRLINLPRRVWSPPNRVRSRIVRGVGAIGLTAGAVLCTAWASPQTLTGGETIMKTSHQTWKRSLGLFGTISALIHGNVALADNPSKLADGNPPPAPNVELDSVGQPAQNIDSAATPNQSNRGNRGSNQNAFNPEPDYSGMDPRLLERYGLKPRGSSPNRYPMTQPAKPDGERQRVQSKLERILLKEVQFTGLPLSEVLKSLQEESRRNDSEKQGINFLISNVPDASEGLGANVDPTTGVPLPVPPVDVNSVIINFNLPLRNVRLKDALEAITKVADTPLKYSIEDFGVIFSLAPGNRASYGVGQPFRPSESAPLQVRTFRVDTNTFLGGLESAFGIAVAEPSRKADSKNDRAKQSDEIQQALRRLLDRLHVNLDEPNKAVFYNDLTGIIMVRASSEDMAIVQAAIETLGGTLLSQMEGLPATAHPGYGGGGGGGYGGAGFGTAGAEATRQRYGIGAPRR